jgi:isohexenylglutaconyl-CoA hydratase
MRNAMSLDMVGELRQVLAAAETDGTTRVIVLRGAGGHFCAGADLKDMAMARARLADAPGGTNPIAEVNAAFGELCLAYARTPLALIAVLEGTVMGGGFGLACVADVAIGVGAVSFRLPETSLGVIPAQIAPFLIERLGYSQAKRLAVTGGKIDGKQALKLGLLHGYIEDSQSGNDLVANTVHSILLCAPGAIAATKALMAQGRFTPPEHMISEAARVFAQAALGAEGIEGTTAFLQKRKPSWAPAEE